MALISLASGVPQFTPSQHKALLTRDEDLSDGGVMRKPLGCRECAYRTVGAGFCPDWLPASPRIACLLEAPGENEIIKREPLVGKSGQYWERVLLEPLGLSKANVLVANTIRCRPRGMGKGGDAWNDFPTGKLRKHVLQLCRQYDDAHGDGSRVVPGGLATWDPNAFVVTFHPSALLRAPMLRRLVRRSIERALGLADRGYRPLVLMGDVAMELVAPFLSGGVKRWASTYWLGNFPFKRGS